MPDIPIGGDVTALMGGGGPAVGADVSSLMNGGPKRKADLSTTEGLVNLADQAGIGDQARAITDKPKRLSMLQRLAHAVGALNPADAMLTATNDLKDLAVPNSELIPHQLPKFAAEYAKGVGRGLASAVTGTDYEPDRRGFREVVQATGATKILPETALPPRLAGNVPKELNFTNPRAVTESALGLAGDIALDPSTYVGGTLIKAGATGATRAGMGAVEKLSPAAAEALRTSGQGIKDALGQLFVYGHGTSQGVPEKALELQGALSKAKEGIVNSNVERLGKGALTADQQAELVQRLLAGKRAEMSAKRRAEQALAEADNPGAATQIDLGIENPVPKGPSQPELPGIREAQPVASQVPEIGQVVDMPGMMRAAEMNATQQNLRAAKLPPKGQASLALDQGEVAGAQASLERTARANALDTRVRPPQAAGPEIDANQMVLPGLEGKEPQQMFLPTSRIEQPKPGVVPEQPALSKAAEPDFDLNKVKITERRGPGYVQRVLDDVGEGTPGLAIEARPDPMKSGGLRTHIVYRAQDGKPVATAILQRTDDGRLAISNFAVDSSRGMLSGRAVKAIGDRALQMDALRPFSGVSPEGENFLRKFFAKESKPTQLRLAEPKIPKGQAVLNLEPKEVATANRLVEGSKNAEAMTARVRPPEWYEERNKAFWEESARQTREGGKEAARAAATSADPAVQKALEGQMTRSQKFARQSGIQDPFTAYFPGINAERLQRFFEGTSGMRVGSQGYKKMFRNALKDEQLVRNPAEAFARREYEMVKDRLTQSTLQDIVHDSGKPIGSFANDEAARAAGYLPIKEKGQFGRPLGYVKESDKRFIDSLVSPEYSGIDKLARATGFDALTSLFKRSVTGLFPSFHVRNYLSGHLQNFEELGAQALHPHNIADGTNMALAQAMPSRLAGETIDLAGKTKSLKSVLKPFDKRFGGSSSYIADIGDATSENPTWFTHLMGTRVGGAVQKIGEKTIGQNGPAFRAARAVGQFIEQQQKATAYVTALRKGMTTEEALQAASRAGFDYRALTSFESRVMRRLVPFYGFTRKNAELQLRTLGEHPERINQIMQTLNNVGEQPSQHERDRLPDYVRGSFAVKLPDADNGMKQYLSNFGTGIEQFASTFDTSQNAGLHAVSQLNPVPKLFLEYTFGKDSFRQKDIKDVYDAREYKTAPQMIKDLLQIKEVEKPVYQKNARGKLVQTGTRTQYVANPERLLFARSLFTSRGFSTLDNMFGGDVQGAAKWLKLLTGVRPQQIDLETSQSIEDQKQKRDLEDLLQRYGQIATIHRAFQPKRAAAH